MNFTSRKQWILGGMGLVLGACASTPVPVQPYALAGGRAEYRDYVGAKANICDTAEPRWLLDELSGVNGLLARFLSSTEQVNNPASSERAQQTALLKDAADSLPKVLVVHESNLKALQSCGFARSGAFPELTRRGQELVELSRGRLKEGEQLLVAQEERSKWKEEGPQREQKARETWCAKQPEVGSTDLFYARRFANGRTEWLFCDGHMVSATSPDAEPTLSGPELSAKERRKVKPARYLEAARGYPAEEIDKQPSGTVAPPASGSATPTP
ncbi:hypothetical protein [Melittangium boletus]|uniref:hypothetical protein n=1 Tax=Melittangium boletus TaxID=83453 RepID=UPI003DA1C97F